MTERLYYNDPYLREFSATVVAAEAVDGRRTVRLDRTAFYPTSGGQPYDVGVLGDAQVVEVLDSDAGVRPRAGGDPGASGAGGAGLSPPRRFPPLCAG